MELRLIGTALMLCECCGSVSKRIGLFFVPNQVLSEIDARGVRVI